MRPMTCDGSMTYFVGGQHAGTKKYVKFTAVVGVCDKCGSDMNLFSIESGDALLSCRKCDAKETLKGVSAEAMIDQGRDASDCRFR